MALKEIEALKITLPSVSGAEGGVYVGWPQPGAPTELNPDPNIAFPGGSFAASVGGFPVVLIPTFIHSYCVNFGTDAAGQADKAAFMTQIEPALPSFTYLEWVKLETPV